MSMMQPELPPELAALMGGGGGAPMAGGDPMAGMAPEPAADPAAGGGDSTTSILERMIADAKLYVEVEQDEEDKLTMTKVLTTLQQYLADEQKETDDLLGGKVSPRALRKVSGGGA